MHPICLPISSNQNPQIRKKEIVQVLGFANNGEGKSQFKASRMEVFDEIKCNVNLLQTLNEKESECE